MRPVIVLAVLAAFAGCVAPVPPAGVDFVEDPFLVQHDHWDPESHALAHNLREVFWDPLASPGMRSNAHVVDVYGDTLVVGTAGETNGFQLFDLSDPAVPAFLGRFHTDSPLSLDRTVMFGADGRTVFVGGSEDIIAVDVSDPMRPEEAARFTNPRFGAHTLFAAEVHGTQFVYVVGYGLLTLSYDAAAREFTLLSRYVAATPEGVLDAPLGPDGTTYLVRDTHGHDVFAGVDPVSGKHLAYVAYSYEGLKVVDLTDPRLPEEVASWRPGGDDAPWYVHTIWVEKIDGKRFAVVGSEVFENRHVNTPSPVWVLDLTDLGAPDLLSTWTNPGGKGSDNILFSAHDLRITPEGMVPLSHYHGGVWLLDLRTLAAGAVEDATLGYALPNRDNGWRPDGPCCLGFNMAGIPLTFDVLMRGEYLYAADLHSGLYVYEYRPEA